MKAVFLQILDMSVSASILAGAVMVLRLLLKKAPKYIHCILWAMVALRLVCPSLPESQVSVMPDSHPVSSVVQQPQQQAPVTNVQPPVQAPQVSVPDHTVSVVPEPNKTVDWVEVFSVIWLSGVAILALYGMGSYFVLRRKVAPAVKEDGIWLCDSVASPFILGIFRPRIYLPSVLQPEYRASVLAHEQAHLRRKDHWWKPLGFALLAVHWFNPVMRIAYILLCRDIEAACDERVVKGMEPGDRKVYSEALLSCAAPRRSIAACPLAFGEQGVKGRIKSVLSYKKPAVWIVLVTVIASVAVAVFFLTDPKGKRDEGVIEYNIPANSTKLYAVIWTDIEQYHPEYFDMNHRINVEVFIWEEDNDIWCGIIPVVDKPISQEELDNVQAIQLSNAGLVLNYCSFSAKKVHILGQFSSLNLPDGRHCPNDILEMYLMERLFLVNGFEIYGKDWLRYDDRMNAQSCFYVSTGEMVNASQVGILLAEKLTITTCLFGGYKPHYNVYSVLGEDSDYLAVYSVDEQVYRLFQRKEPGEKVPSQETSTSIQLVMDMNIVYSMPSCPAFEENCFYATDSNGDLFRVKFDDMSGLYQGQSIRVTYFSTSKLKIEYPNGYPDGGYTPKYEVTAIKAEPLPAQNEYVSMVYFIQEDAGHYWGAPNLEGAKYYAIPVTAEERDTLLKMEEGRVWQDTRLSSSLPASHMTMNVVVDGSWNFFSVNDDRYIVKERYYAVLTQEERDFIKALKSQAFETTYAQNYFTDDYLVYQQKTKQSS